MLTDGFVEQFEKRLAQADAVWLASAWVTQGEALDALIAGRCKAKVLVGIHGNATDPQAIRLLIDRFGPRSVQIVDSDPLFHAKLFLFRQGDGKTVVWIGSANFTRGGFGSNREVLLEVDATGVARQADAWFVEQWDVLRGQDVEAVLRQYSERRQKKGISKELQQLVEPSGRPMPDVTTHVTFAPRQGRGPRKYTGEVVVMSGQSRQTLPYGSATEALCAVLEVLRRGHRRLLWECESEDSFFQKYRKDGTISRFLARNREEILEVRAARGELTKAMQERVTERGIKPVSLARGWWVSRDTNREQVWKMVRTAARIASVELSPNDKNPGF